MMIKATLNNCRIASRKVRLVANLVRGKKTSDALAILQFANKQAALPISKLIKTAMADAKHNYNLDDKDFVVREIFVNEGLTYKRWMPKAMGRATPVRKRGSNIVVGLEPVSNKTAQVSEEVKSEEKVEVKKEVKRGRKATGAAVKKATVKKTAGAKTTRTKKAEDSNK
ncbi:MAG TPA: 50S ribosomal protein L22 [bacterium]|nr:50S ribosomal protein L22 [bacterium]